VIAEDIQQHYTGGRIHKGKEAAVDGNAAITKALAGGLDLNARLTELERGFGESRAELHPGHWDRRTAHRWSSWAVVWTQIIVQVCAGRWASSDRRTAWRSRCTVPYR
jgi:hypothetical protein